MNQRGLLIEHMFRPRFSQFPLPGLFKFYHREGRGRGRKGGKEGGGEGRGEGRGSTFSREKISDAESDSDFPCSNFCKHQNRMNPLLTLGFASAAPTVDLYFLQFCSIIQV